jgi:hypothetical protein
MENSRPTFGCKIKWLVAILAISSVVFILSGHVANLIFDFTHNLWTGIAAFLTSSTALTGFFHKFIEQSNL